MTRKQLQAKVDKANRELASMKKELGTKHGAVKIAVQSAKLTSKDMRRASFAIPKNASKQDLARLEKALDKFNKSQYRTKTGRAKLERESMRRMADKLGFNPNYITKQQKEIIKQVFEVLKSKEFQQLKESKMGISDFAIQEISDELQKGVLSVEDIIPQIGEWARS